MYPKFLAGIIDQRIWHSTTNKYADDCKLYIAGSLTPQYIVEKQVIKIFIALMMLDIIYL